MIARLLLLGAVTLKLSILAASSISLYFPQKACCFLTIHARNLTDKAFNMPGPFLLIVFPLYMETQNTRQEKNHFISKDRPFSPPKSNSLFCIRKNQLKKAIHSQSFNTSTCKNFLCFFLVAAQTYNRSNLW